MKDIRLIVCIGEVLPTLPRFLDERLMFGRVGGSACRPEPRHVTAERCFGEVRQIRGGPSVRSHLLLDSSSRLETPRNGPQPGCYISGCAHVHQAITTRNDEPASNGSKTSSFSCLLRVRVDHAEADQTTAEHQHTAQELHHPESDAAWTMLRNHKSRGHAMQPRLA